MFDPTAGSGQQLAKKPKNMFTFIITIFSFFSLKNLCLHYTIRIDVGVAFEAFSQNKTLNLEIKLQKLLQF